MRPTLLLPVLKVKTTDDWLDGKVPPPPIRVCTLEREEDIDPLPSYHYLLPRRRPQEENYPILVLYLPLVQRDDSWGQLFSRREMYLPNQDHLSIVMPLYRPFAQKESSLLRCWIIDQFLFLLRQIEIVYWYNSHTSSARLKYTTNCTTRVHYTTLHYYRTRFWHHATSKSRLGRAVLPVLLE